MQGQDKQYTHLLAYLTYGTLPTDLSAATRVLKEQGDYFLNDGILYHVWIQPGKGQRSCRSHVQLVIPTQLVKTVLTETHDSPLLGGHLGIARTMWDAYLPFVQYVYNMSPCLASTGYNPAFLVHGRVLRSPMYNLTQQLPEPPRSSQQYVAKLLDVLESARQDAETTLKERKDPMQTKFQPKVHDPEFHVGDSVYLYHPVLTPDQSAKLRSHWTGPHYIVQKFSNVNVQLRRQSDNSLLQGRVHVNRLKKATERNLPTEDSPRVPQDTSIESPSAHGGSGKPKDTSTVSASPTHGPDTLLTPSQDDAVYYEVEELVAKRCIQDEWQYRVKWLTFPSKSNSWVKYEDLNPLCQQLARKIHDCLTTYGQNKVRKRKR